MKEHTRRQRRRAGFTLTEMLVAVGILAVLLTVAVPSIFYYRRELKLTELDDNARAVFVAAQNHLTALRSTSVGDLKVSADVGRGAKEVPAGAISGLEAEAKLMYVSTDVTGAQPGWLVLPGAIEGDLSGENSCYLVEFDPVSGAVYGVFFMEKSEGQLDETAYAKLCQYRSDGKSCRIRDGRRAFSRAADGFYVGYYGADGALGITRPDAKKLPAPKLTLINAEELRLYIKTDLNDWTGVDSDKVYASISVSDGTKTKTLVKKGRLPKDTEVSMVLDTLKTSGYSRKEELNAAGWGDLGGTFAQWVKDGGVYAIAPGADITVTVSIWYQPAAGEGIVALPQTASVATNSLFADRTGDTVKVAYGRHLQNLSSTALDSSVTAAVQAREIDFAKTGDGIYSWADTYGHAARPFEPISNDRLDSYNGAGLPIRNLNAVKASGKYENAGVFGTFSGSRLEKVVLVDARATGENAGALAGTVTGADGAAVTVDGCQVYLDAPTAATLGVDGTVRAGGLIGSTEWCTVQNGTFASTVVDGGLVGGLVGNAKNTTIKNSYAAGHLLGTTVGGLVGGGAAATIWDSYAAGTIRAVDEAGGLSAGAVNAHRSYAAAEYAVVPSSDKVYGAVAPDADSAADRCTDVCYLVKSGVNDSVTVKGVTPIANSEQMKKGQGLSHLGSAFAEGGDPTVMARPYNLPNATNPRDPKLYAPYPYPVLALPVAGSSEKEAVRHYGDWLAVNDAVFLAYFERYADGSYGFVYEHSGEGGTTVTVNTLRGDSGSELYAGGAAIPADHYDAVVEEGYGVLSPGKPSLTTTGGSVTLTEDPAVHLTIDEKEYGLFTLDGAWLKSHHGYQPVTVSGQKVWFDPDFAKTATMTETTTAAATGYSIRSVRQLANLDALSDYASKSFTQELNINGASYEGTLYGKTKGDWQTFPVQFEDTSFRGAFTGGMGKGLSIRSLSITGGDNAGLFGVIEGATVRDVKLENCAVTGSANVGAVIGTLRSGSVTNSGVYVVNAAGSTADAPYSSYPVTAGGSAGGFVGKVTGGTVSKCFAAVQVKGSTAGGLVGSLTGGTVTDSYAGGHMVNGVFEKPEAGKSANITGTDAAGGFVGSWTAGEISGTCYTTASVSAPMEGKIGAFAAKHPSGKTLSQSYARNNVFHGGYDVPESADITALDLDSGRFKGDKAKAHPYDTTVLLEEYDFRPIAGLEHYGDWPELKMLHGIVAYYEQIETASGLKTEFSYYDRKILDAGGDFIEQGTLDPSRTGSLYSDGYAFLSLNQLHETGKETQPVTLKVAIGAAAEIKERPTTYLGSYREDLTPFVADPSNPYDKPTYYAYGLPNSALDAAVDAEKYFLQLRVAGLDSEAELSSLWLNPHFGRAAYNGYGETNPGDGSPKVPIPSATVGTIYIRSVRQFNNMRKYKAAIRNWEQQLDMDASQYEGHVDVDSEGYLTLGGLRVTTESGGTWSPIKAPGPTPTVADIPSVYRLAIEPITMTTPSDGIVKDNWGGTYDGQDHKISNLSIGKVTGVGNKNKERYYSGLICSLSSSAALKNINLTQCDVTGVSGNENAYTGALTGYSEGTILNCTVRDVTISAPSEGSSTDGYVGGFLGYARKGAIGLDSATPAPCTVVNCTVDGGNAAYVGGFTGYESETVIQHCGVHLEGNAAVRYGVQTVTGAGTVGGFVGYQKEGKGTIQYCYAAVKVSGKVAGGFVGTLKGGTLANCFAGGHTTNGGYLPGEPNVTGTDNAGGFVGMWEGGTIGGLCYTTCSAATDSGKADVFATLGKKVTKTVPEGCYAGGDVIVNGVAVNISEHNLTKASVRMLAVEPEAGQVTAYRYDNTLPEKYSHKPITYADGTAMPHYGDWYRKREWDQQLPEAGKKTYPNLGTSVEVKEDKLHIQYTITNTGTGQDMFNTGPSQDGVFCVTSDLGYMLIFRFTEIDGKKVIVGGSGAQFEYSPARFLDADGNEVPLETVNSNAYSYQNIVWDLEIPLSEIQKYAPYVSEITVGAVENAYQAKITMPEGGGVAKKDVDGTISVEDKSFDDWKGYEHQVYEGFPGNQGTPLNGHWTVSMLGYKNKIYLHVIDEDMTDLPGYAATFNNTMLFNFSDLKLTTQDGTVRAINEWWKLGQNQYTKPTATFPTAPVEDDYYFETEGWDPSEGRMKTFTPLRWFLKREDGRVEYEMELDLDYYAKVHLGLENSDTITDVQLGFNAGILDAATDPSNPTLKVMEVKRDPKQ